MFSANKNNPDAAACNSAQVRIYLPNHQIDSGYEKNLFHRHSIVRCAYQLCARHGQQAGYVDKRLCKIG